VFEVDFEICGAESGGRAGVKGIVDEPGDDAGFADAGGANHYHFDFGGLFGVGLGHGSGRLLYIELHETNYYVIYDITLHFAFTLSKRKA
jgi:hypothetical protein